MDLRYELLARETARDALATYDPTSPFENSVAVKIVGLDAAVLLLNDLNCCLIRFVAETLVKIPSVSDSKWRSRRFVTAVRTDAVPPEEPDRLLKVFGIEDGRLVEPMFLAYSDDAPLLEYDLRNVAETVRVRVTEDQYLAKPVS